MKFLRTLKKIMKTIGYIITWPMASLYRGIDFLESHGVDAIFSAIALMCFVACGVMDYLTGTKISDIILLYVPLYMVVGGLGAWAINTSLNIFLWLLRPMYLMNIKCRNDYSSKNHTDNNIDNFIKTSQYIKSYQMRPIQQK